MLLWNFSEREIFTSSRLPRNKGVFWPLGLKITIDSVASSCRKAEWALIWIIFSKYGISSIKKYVYSLPTWNDLYRLFGNFLPMRWKQNTCTICCFTHLLPIFVLSVVGMISYNGQELQEAVQSVTVACWEQVHQKLSHTLLLIWVQHCCTQRAKVNDNKNDRNKRWEAGDEGPLHVVLMKAVYSSLVRRGSGMSLKNSFSRAATSWTLCSSSSRTSMPRSNSSRSWRGGGG